MRVLLVEDDSKNQETYQAIRDAGFAVECTDMGYEALEMVRCDEYDLILLDLMIPDIDGYELIQHLQACGLSIPIIVLSASCQPQAKVRAFALGVDDFITRPFNNAELTARMQAVLRRGKACNAPVLSIGGLQLNPQAKQASVDGAPVALSSQEYAVLELLVQRQGKAVSKDAFLSRLFSGIDELEMELIDSFIGKLRKKLEPSGIDRLITPIHGRGFMLCREDQAFQPVHLPFPAHLPPFVTAPDQLLAFSA